MKSVDIRKAFFLLGAMVIVLLAFGYTRHSGNSASAGNMLMLQPPSFVNIAHAEEDEIASFIEDEAGITAYMQTANPINLTVVRDAFRTIEYETTDYIIGSVELPDYPESHDVHVYVHVDGWVVAYYLAADPTGKIMDLGHYDGVSITTTKLEIAMAKVVILIGIVSFDASYYDFRYPNATNLMLIAEKSDGVENNSFDVQLPGNYTFYERSWSHALYRTYLNDSSNLYLNGLLINSLNLGTWQFGYGNFTIGQMPPGVFHTIEVSLAGSGGGHAAYAGIALTYQE